MRSGRKWGCPRSASRSGMADRSGSRSTSSSPARWAWARRTGRRSSSGASCWAVEQARARSPSERSLVDKAVILADHRHIRDEAELAGAESLLPAPPRVTVAKQLGGAAGMQGVVLRVIHLAARAGPLERRAEDAGADADSVLAHEDDLGRVR